MLVAGGGGNSGAIGTAELYDPTTNLWSSGGSLATARYSHTATLLASGKVLVVGGETTTGSVFNSAELYDPTTNTWSAAGSLAVARYAHTASLLGSGKVLVAGGFSLSAALNSAELYDPATNTWSSGGSLVGARGNHTATLLANGKVLAAAGYGGGQIGQSPLNTAELYDPTANTWSATGSLAAARGNYASTRLANAGCS